MKAASPKIEKPVARRLEAVLFVFLQVKGTEPFSGDQCQLPCWQNCLGMGLQACQWGIIWMPALKWEDCPLWVTLGILDHGGVKRELGSKLTFLPLPLLDVIWPAATDSHDLDFAVMSCMMNWAKSMPSLLNCYHSHRKRNEVNLTTLWEATYPGLLTKSWAHSDLPGLARMVCFVLRPRRFSGQNIHLSPMTGSKACY